MKREDLSGLTREQKLQKLDLMQERKRRLRERVAYYKPNQGQLPVHQSDKKVRLVVSGNGSGKTTLAVQEALWAADGYNPITNKFISVPRKVIVLLDKPDKVADKWLPEIRKWFKLPDSQLAKNGKPYYNSITRNNGSEIKFFFHEQEELSFESIEVDDVICDEPPKKKVYTALIRGMRNKNKNPRLLIIGTPLSGAWLRRDIYEPWANGEAPDTECFKYSTRVNEDNLPDGYVDWFSSKLSEKERRIRIDGDFFDLDGLALSHLFSRSSHMLPKGYWSDELARKYPCVIAIDPHPSKRHVAALIGADETGPVWIKELAEKSTARVFAKSLKAFMSGYRVVDIVCDSLGAAEMTGGEGFKSFIQVLIEEGIQVRSTSYKDKNDEDWIMRIQDVLAVPEEDNNFGQRSPKLRIIEGNSGIVGDIETVEWGKSRNSDDFKVTLAIERKDYLACLKYGLSTNLTYTKSKDKVYYRNKSAYGVEPRHRRKMDQTAKMGIGQQGRAKRGKFSSW